MTKKEFASKLWKEMHQIASEYSDNPSEDDKIRIKKYFHQLEFDKNKIVCLSCRNHFLRFYKRYTSTLDEIISSRYNLFLFFWRLHNNVNRILHKEEISFDVICKEYNISFVDEKIDM